MVECVTRREYLERKQYILKELPPGNYSVRVMATSLAGNGEYSPKNHFIIEENRSGNTTPIIVGVIGVILVSTTFILAYFFLT